MKRKVLVLTSILLAQAVYAQEIVPFDDSGNTRLVRPTDRLPDNRQSVNQLNGDKHPPDLLNRDRHPQALFNGDRHPVDRLDREQAREYMLQLVNRDRQSQGLKPVLLDAVATRAGQMHTDEMAMNGYLSHWDLAGRKPDERYSESGGRYSVMENCDYSWEGSVAENVASRAGTNFQLDQEPTFSRRQIDRIESAFFNEKPPMDGHRKNILDPVHTAVGIALSTATIAGLGSRLACTQEFINRYGEFDQIPTSLNLGERFTLKGNLPPGYDLHDIDLLFEPLPKPMTLAQLNNTYSYSQPNNRLVTFFPPPYNSPAPVQIQNSEQGQAFAVLIQTDRNWQPGLYYFSVWARPYGAKVPIPVSSRTIVMRSVN